MIRLLPLALLVGCAQAQIKQAPPCQSFDHDAVAKLLHPCFVGEPVALSVQEAIRLASQRRASLEKCNADKAALRALLESSP